DRVPLRRRSGGRRLVHRARPGPGPRAGCTIHRRSLTMPVPYPRAPWIRRFLPGLVAAVLLVVPAACSTDDGNGVQQPASEAGFVSGTGAITRIAPEDRDPA